MSLDSDKFSKTWSFMKFDLNMEKSDYQGMGKCEMEGYSKVVSDDIADLLPVDPFGMDIKSTVMAIKGWLQDFEEDSDSNFGKLGIDEAEKSIFYAGLDWFLNGAASLHPKDNLNVGAISFKDHSFSGFGIDGGLNNDGLGSESNISNWVVCDKGKELLGEQNFDKDPDSNFSKFGVGEAEKSIFDTGLDWFFNGAVSLGPKDNLNIGAFSFQDHSFNGSGIDGGLNNGGVGSKCNSSNWAVCDKEKELQSEAAYPHDAFDFILGYLEVKDLLVFEGVCRYFRNEVRGKSYLWKNIHIDQPLSEKITDEALVRLTSRAQGSLECLSLVGCIRITDNGLKQVLESNPRLTKLCVPGCVKLTVDGILFNLRVLESAGLLRIKQLRIGGLGVTEKQFEELCSLLGADNNKQMKGNGPQFHRLGQLYMSCDDDRFLDVEICPRCQKPRLVYDCPAESCQGKDQANPLCRACTLCIPRCIHCGRCIKDRDFEETFCLDFLCLDCLRRLLNCQGNSEIKGVSSPGQAFLHQEMRCHFWLYGE